MSAISDFKKFQQDQSNALRWAGLLGKEYCGGGGGIGSLHSIEASLTIYHQEYDGATNYHDAPELIRFAIEKQIRARFPEILSDALSDLTVRRAELAAKAQTEYSALMEEAGLVTP